MEDKERINALRDSILEQCREQGVTVNEFESVVRSLRCAIDRRHSELTDSVLIPKDKPLRDYYHVF